MRSLERATFLATIIGLVLLVGVLYLRMSDDDSSIETSAAVVPSPPAAVTTPATPAATTAAGPTPTSRAASVVVNVRREQALVWPAVGPITSYFGPGHPTGIDIALNGNNEAPVRAAASGTVTFVGGDTCCEYGLNVVVDHGNGRSTLYGHLSEFRVEEGQDVDQGQVIGLGGATGNADGKHLHFEYAIDGSVVDPLRYLSIDKRTEPESVARVYACRPGSIPIDPASIVRVSFLPTTTIDLRLESVSLESPPAGTGAPAVELAKDGNLAILNIGPVGAAFGQSYGYKLRAELVQPGDVRQTVECSLDLETLETLPNVIDSGDDSFASAGADDGSSPDGGDDSGEAGDGETPGAPEGSSPTATSTRVPSRTPVPTATRGAPQGAVFPTATPAGPRGAPFPTATPAAPKPLQIASPTRSAPAPAYQPTKAPTAAR